MKTIGIRIPNHPFCLALAHEFGKPITTTSANKSGEKPERNTYSSILQNIGIADIDLVIDTGELPERQPSTVIDVSSGEVVILREGAISAVEIGSAITPNGSNGKK